jgi:Tc toxin complex TcA C-terminal TcB-binding domain/Neuraminidase-like domain
MQAIHVPVDARSSIADINNLQDALALFLQKDVFRLPDADRTSLEEGLRAERQTAKFWDVTRKLVGLFQDARHLEGTGEVDEPTAKEMNALLKEFGALDVATMWLVRGHIENTDSAASNILVRVFDRDLRQNQLLGEAMTDDKGYFEISYQTADFAAGDVAISKITSNDSPVPDLIFELSQNGQTIEKLEIYRLPNNANDANIVTSTLVSEDDSLMGFEARNIETVRIIVVSAVQKQPLTLFEQLILAIGNLLPERIPAGSTANTQEKIVGEVVIGFDEEKSRDVSFAARETGFDKNLIAALQLAFKQSHQFENVPAWAFFGLSSQDVLPDAVIGMSQESLVLLLKTLQPSYHQEDLEAVAKSLKQFFKDKNISNEVTSLRESAGDLLKPILGSEEKLSIFLDAYARHEGEIEKFWDEMLLHPELSAVVPKIQLNLQLSQLTLNNKGLINALQEAGIQSTRELVDVSAEKWEALALEHRAEMPKHIWAKSDRESANIYAQELQTLVEMAFPTDVIKKNIQQPQVKLFLEKNPTFDFAKTPVESYLQKSGAEAFRGIEQEEVVKTHLRQMQRLYNVTANAKDMNVLMDAGFESAHQIAGLTAEDFRQRLDGKVLDKFALEYHAKASAVSETTAMIGLQMRDFLGTANFKAAGGSLPTSNFELPDLKTLFGSMDTCECEHCKSVYSPAAYFVDLLHILLGQQNGKARKELFRRRPDLKYTKLTCQHTDTFIPYIDLVNEILETYVVQDNVGNGLADAHAKEATNDTSSFTAEELAANPQHPNDESRKDAVDAYKAINENVVYPLNLPFDMNLELARQFLQKQNSSRFDILNTFGKVSPIVIAAEKIGISLKELEVLTLKKLDGSPAAFGASDLWGKPAALADLAIASEFIYRANITIAELIELLQAEFLNPNYAINEFFQDLPALDRATWIVANPDENPLILKVIELGSTDKDNPCDLDKITINHINGNLLTEVELSLFNRFIRLWRKIGCTIKELDGLLLAMSVKDITLDVIQDLSMLWQLKQELDLPWEQLAVLKGKIPSVGKDSLYAKLFLNQAILQIDPNLGLNFPQTETVKSSDTLKDHVPVMLAAFQISEEDFNGIVAYTKLDLATGKLVIENLSTIYRYVLFAKSLNLKISDLLTWLDLIPQLPWTSLADLMATKEILAKLNKFGFRAPDFAYVSLDRISAGNALPPKAEVIEQATKTLREGLQKITQENTPADDVVTADFLKLKLGLLFDAEEVARVVGILVGTNEENDISYLLAPKILEVYKNVLDGYLAAGDIKATDDVQTRLNKYWDKVKVKLLPLLRKTYVQQHVISTFKVNADLATYLLGYNDTLKTCLDVEIDNPANNAAYNELYITIYKTQWLIGKFKLSAKELEYFQGNASFNNFDWKKFDFANWFVLADYVILRNLLPVAEKDLLSIFEKANLATSTLTDVAEAIKAVTDWNKKDVEYFVNKIVIAPITKDIFLNEKPLITLHKQIELSRLIGVSIENLESWATNSVGSDQALEIKRTLKAKYDDVAWIEVSTQAYNSVRTKLRDALVGYLLQKPEIKALNLKDTNDLYNYFLIDVEMDACMLTSRLVQAIASVQQYFHRCLLNLESKPPGNILPNLINKKQWSWMKNYRVWEANRKVFLYPENWIEPELRDNKSPFFKELESELLQGEVTNDSVEKALVNYLEKLHDVARLDVCGTYEDKEAQELHVFGRTFNNPPQYYYRKRNLKTEVWTAWDRVQLDIQGTEEGDSAGVHLIPVVWNRRLYLFWPIFTEKQYQIKSANQTITRFYWEVKIAWSECKNNRWASKKISNLFIETPSDWSNNPSKKYRFTVTKDPTLKLNMVFFGDPFDSIGEFQFDCGSEVLIKESIQKYRELFFFEAKYNNFYQGFQSKTRSVSVKSIFNPETGKFEYPVYPDSFSLIAKGNLKLLENSADIYKLQFSSDSDFFSNSTSKIFYQDHKRSYLVESVSYFSYRYIYALAEQKKSIIPKSKFDIAQLAEPVDKTYSSPHQTINYTQLTSTGINQLVDDKQIDISTSMQIQVAQSLSGVMPSQVAEYVKPAQTSVAEIYYKPFRYTEKYKFSPFFHAYVCKYLEALNKGGIQALLTIQNQLFTDWDDKKLTNNFKQIYQPDTANVEQPYPNEDVDFRPSGAYSIYNWELFFHIPMLLANRLSKNQRFEEAMQWYHFIFDPTTNDKEPSSQRYWQVAPLRSAPKIGLAALFELLSRNPSDPERKKFEDAITEWRNNPFNPHLVARMRLVAYQKNVCFKYLDNLIAWADYLYRQNTRESINQALQLYIVASEMLGKRPNKMPARGTIKALNYDELENSPNGLDAFSNTSVKLETMFPFYNIDPTLIGSNDAAAILNSVGDTLYFCLPDNDKLLGYWDIIADRLFKIRHCQNIDGVEQQLALFEPPIDPALLVQAVAGGVDIGSVLADLNAPLPYYRFNYIVLKALEICAELKSLGNGLLSALEKKDNEALLMMRAEQESLLLNLVRTVKKFQITETQRTREGLEKTKEVTEIRANYYSQLIKEGLNSSEKEQQTLSALGMVLSVAGQYFETAASLAVVIPDAFVGAIVGVPSGAITLNHIGGGTKGGAAAGAMGRFFQMGSTIANYAANAAQTNAINERRANDWKFQQDLANKELTQINKQILAAQIREQIAEQELTNQEKQIENANQIEEFYRNKFTQEELYGWMMGEISTVYFQCYQLAYDLAKKAEKTYRYELGLPTSNFVQFGIWDSFRKGLLSGEKLYLSLKQMEKSYMDLNRREFEISKNVSLLMHNPLALIKLKEVGSCEIELPETLFDMDYPGHYMRRIKSVSISIPCVAGPNTSVNCTLTLLKSRTRVKSVPANSYDVVDNRFVQNFAAMQSIATSHGQNDSGLFELNFRDERYLPFEGNGVASTWRIELPSDIRQFDYQTISDVVLHLKYTSRDGGKQLKTESTNSLKKLLKDSAKNPEARLFSLRHEFPSEWHKLLTTSDSTGNHSQTFVIDKQRFPFVFSSSTIKINNVSIFGYPKSENDTPDIDKLILNAPNNTVLTFENKMIKFPAKIGSKLFFKKTKSTSPMSVEVKNIGLNISDVEWSIKVFKTDVEKCLDKLEDIILMFEYTVDIK